MVFFCLARLETSEHWLKPKQEARVPYELAFTTYFLILKAFSCGLEGFCGRHDEGKVCGWILDEALR